MADSIPSSSRILPLPLKPQKMCRCGVSTALEGNIDYDTIGLSENFHHLTSMVLEINAFQWGLAWAICFRPGTLCLAKVETNPRSGICLRVTCFCWGMRILWEAVWNCLVSWDFRPTRDWGLKSHLAHLGTASCACIIIIFILVTFMVLNTFCAIVRTLSQGPRWSNPALKQSTNRSNRSNSGWFKDIFTNKHVAIGIQRCHDKRSEALIKNPTIQWNLSPVERFEHRFEQQLGWLFPVGSVRFR